MSGSSSKTKGILRVLKENSLRGFTSWLYLSGSDDLTLGRFPCFTPAIPESDKP